MEQLKPRGKKYPKKTISVSQDRLFIGKGLIEENVRNRITSDWLKGRSASGVLCGHRIPISLKAKVMNNFKTWMLYGSGCWTMRKHVNTMMYPR